MTTALVNKLISLSHYLITDRDVAVSEFFSRQVQKHGVGFQAHGLQHPQSIVFYRMIGALRTWEDPEGLCIALIGYPVDDLEFSQEKSLPSPNFNGRYFYGHCLASEIRARGRAMKCVVDHIRTCYPQVTHMFGYRGARKTRPMRIRKELCPA